MSVHQERSPVLGLTMRELREVRHGDLSPGGHRRRSPTRSPMRPSSIATNSTGYPHHAQTMLQRRHSKTSKSSTTPIISPRRPSHPGRDSSKASLGHSQSHNKTQEPGYFFGIDADQTHDAFESSGFPKHDPSPSSSSIRSFGAAIPKHIPLDANPEFEAFRKQADLNRGRSLALPTHGLGPEASKSAPTRPHPSRWHTHSNDSGPSFFAKSHDWSTEQPDASMDIDQEGSYDTTNTSFGMKRNSESSAHPNYFVSSHANEPLSLYNPSQRHLGQPKLEDSAPRLSVLEYNRTSPPTEPQQPPPRVATAQPKSDDNLDRPSMISASRLQELSSTANPENLLLLDIRSASSYAQSRIAGALNICVPTMLLKRATYNTTMLEQTLQRDADIAKFSKWSSMHCIVVYDAHSSEKKDAISAVNMTKKFIAEGFKGNLCILKGGFQALSNQCASLVDSSSLVNNSGQSKPSSKGIAPVIGGVTMPMTKNEPNPFFSEIRQNMDLADGVGQLEIKTPYGLASPGLPNWLKQAAADTDHGQQVSKKFLTIEREEQSRMREAFSAFNLSAGDAKGHVQLSGVEQGRKNRYKNILPFEHARVKLQDTNEKDCDYFNASHIQASRSQKKYIATQGPLPATFDDFWSVVWEQDVRVIVMLTAESEGGQLKCHPYWKGGQFGNLKLKFLSEKKTSLDMDKHRLVPTSDQAPGADAASGRKRSNTTTGAEVNEPTKSAQSQNDAPYVFIRKFALTNALKPFEQIREITHIHFSAWPDFGTPAQPSHLLALVELANMMQQVALPFNTSSIVDSRSRNKPQEGHSVAWNDEPESDENTRPMLVHCSAGCGRTGTFCTVDSVIDMLKRQKRAGQGAIGSQDHEGDTEMADNVDSSIPTTREKTTLGSFEPRKSVGMKMSSSASQLDTTWIRGDGLDLIQKTVEDFRQQRLSMVQSLRQYVLCYETVLEWVHRIHESERPPIVQSR